MRISDLSSDVCSSDLVFGQLKTIALLAWVFFMGAIGFALVPFSGNALVLAAIAFFFGLGMGIGIPLTVILMFSRTVEGRSGQTLGLRLTANNLVRVSGPIVFGAVGSALGQIGRASCRERVCQYV